MFTRGEDFATDSSYYRQDSAPEDESIIFSQVQEDSACLKAELSSFLLVDQSSLWESSWVVWSIQQTTVLVFTSPSASNQRSVSTGTSVWRHLDPLWVEPIKCFWGLADPCGRVSALFGVSFHVNVGNFWRYFLWSKAFLGFGSNAPSESRVCVRGVTILTDHYNFLKLFMQSDF